MILLSQRDNRWRLKRLGFSNSTIGLFGCVVTCYGMVWDARVDDVNEYFKNNDCFVNLNLVYWAKTPGFIWRGWTYDNKKVLEAIEKYGFCIVETDLNDNPRDGKHFVVFIGNGMLYDPWDGKEKPVSSYKDFYGYVVIDPSKNPLKYTGGEFMEISTEERDFLIGRSVVAKETAEFLGISGDPDKVTIDEIKKSIGGIKGRVTELEGKLGEVEATATNREEQVGRLKEQLLEEHKLYKELSNKLKQTSDLSAGAIGLLEGRVRALQGQVDSIAIEKGKLVEENTLLKLKREYKILLEIKKLKLALIKFK